VYLVVISGFLGTGKTTAMLSFAAELRRAGRKTALIVNEIGEIGIDNVILRQSGASVWELLGGCICCTLAGSLAATLERLAAEYHPDIVLMEPSGAAHPDAVKAGLQFVKGGPVELKWLALVDPLRLEELVAVLEPLMTSHAQAADAVLITKAALATAEQIAAAERWIAGLRSGVPCFCADMAGDAPRPALRTIFPCLS
jgi:G3E family GTPase